MLRNACDIGSDAKSLKDFEEEQNAAGMTAELQSHARKPATLQVPGRHSMRITLLPPLTPEQRQDVHSLADVAKAADVVLLCMAHPEAPSSKRGKPAGALDAEGSLALQVLRSMGLPQVFVAVQGVGPSMKQRSHAKKLATSALEAELSGDLKVCSTSLPILHRASLPVSSKLIPEASAQTSRTQRSCMYQATGSMHWRSRYQCCAHAAALPGASGCDLRAVSRSTRLLRALKC